MQEIKVPGTAVAATSTTISVESSATTIPMVDPSQLNYSVVPQYTYGNTTNTAGWQNPNWTWPPQNPYYPVYSFPVYPTYQVQYTPLGKEEIKALIKEAIVEMFRELTE